VATTVPFKLITPAAIKFDGQAELVIAVGTEGETGILPHHAPYLTTVRPGVLRANIVEGEQTKRLELATGEGFLQVLPDRITLLVDAAFDGKEVDIDKARRELGEARERQTSAGANAEVWRREQYAIDFATAKLHVAGVH
jgi:F-type H+-transporting ATPase subunit epsilon